MSNKPDRITFQTRFEEMVGTLRKEILSSIRPAGDYLPSELALADQYLLSKNPSARRWISWCPKG